VVKVTRMKEWGLGSGNQEEQGEDMVEEISQSTVVSVKM